jgi:hypothetical protein
MYEVALDKLSLLQQVHEHATAFHLLPHADHLHEELVRVEMGLRKKTWISDRYKRE